MPKVILFCGVESTGKSTMISKVKEYLLSKSYSVEVIDEYGRDVCENSGGVFEMNLDDYELILYGHQHNIVKTISKDCDYILLDTDSVYTRYYLDKDIELQQKDFKRYEAIVKTSEDIVKYNTSLNRISSIIFLNSDCPFVQDGTRTYESSRQEDNITLLNLYKKLYPNELINVITGSDYSSRYNKCIKIIKTK